MTGPGPYQHVIVGTDGSATAQVAVLHAARLARACGARLTIVSAYTRAPVGATDLVSPDAWLMSDAAGAQDHVVDGQKLALTEGAPNVRCRTEAGDPASVILDVAADHTADAIVVGSRGMATASRFILGSVPNRVSHHAACDVIIVKTAD